MKPIVVFDASFFSIPSSMESSDALEALTNRIGDWAERVLSQNCVDFCMMSDTVSVLSESGCFPALQNIQAQLELFSLDHVFSAHDINLQLITLIGRARYFNEITGMEAAAISQGHICGVDLSSLPDKRFELALNQLAASIIMSPNKEIIRSVLGTQCASPKISSSYTIESVINRDGREIISEKIQHISGNVDVVDSPTQFLSSLTPLSLWHYAETSIELNLAVALQVAADIRLTINCLPLPQPNHSLVGSKFVQSLQGANAYRKQSRSAILLRKCAEAVTGIKGQYVRDFRKTRTADGAQGHRMQVGKSHEALRLMMWITDNNEVELANVGRKHDLEIEDGTPSQAAYAIF